MDIAGHITYIEAVYKMMHQERKCGILTWEMVHCIIAMFFFQ